MTVCAHYGIIVASSGERDPARQKEGTGKKMAELINQQDWRIVIHEAEEGGYWGEVPAMPGCVSEGESVEECKANVMEAARGCLETYLKMAYVDIDPETIYTEGATVDEVRDDTRGRPFPRPAPRPPRPPKHPKGGSRK